MSSPLIPGGYILLSRKLIESEIWRKPPLYLKIWIYLLSKAQHKEYKNLKRGQLWITYQDIMEDCSWMVGARKEKPSKSQVFNILEWMRNTCSESNDESNSKATTNETMITTTKATRGILITIVNFNVYQNSKNYESNSENNDESNDENSPNTTATRNRINKNDNKNNNNISIYSIFDSYSDNADLRQALRDYSIMRNKIKAPLTERAVTLLLNKLDALASTDELKIKLLENATLSNWKSVYPLKEEKQQDKPKQGKPNKFHNFIQSDDNQDLEAMARKRFEKLIQGKKKEDKYESGI
jgi:hypothetical protein